LRRYSPTKLWDGAQMAIFGDFFTSCVFSEPRAADLHLKFALRPHHVWKVRQTSMRIGEENKNEERKIEQTTE